MLLVYMARNGYLIFLLKFSVGMDHVRVHPKFLHSNATSHKWALGGKVVQPVLQI
jgi:hypothetical protein